LAIACALSLMGGVFAASYYQDHGAPIASVNGEAISKDALSTRVKVDRARYDRRLTEDQTMRNQGKISTDDYATLESAITNSETSLSTDGLTEIINEAELRQYASKNNITVTDQQVDDQIKLDSTVPELRYVKIISVPVEATAPASAPTQADSDKALAQAQAYLAEVKAGKSWDDVATEAEAGQQMSTNSGGGDIGLKPKADLTIDPDLADAIFNLAKTGDTTAIMQGVNGAYRFATVTTIVPSWVDSGWETSMNSAAGSDAYRDYARNEAINKAIQKVIEAKYISGETVQRDVREIQVRSGFGQLGDGDEVKVSLMVFSPSHNMSTANTDTDTTDANWTDALARAKAAVAKLHEDPTKFSTMAKDSSTNDDTNFASMAGNIPWIPSDWFNATTEADPTTGQTNTGLGMTNVANAVFQSDLPAGTILDPVLEPNYGYVVVLFQGRRPAPAQRIANAAFDINSGVDFETEAKSVSEAADAINGGDLGWVSPYMLTSEQQAAIYATPVGRATNIIDDGSGGYYMYKVVSEQTRAPDAAQQAKLKKVVYSSWLNELNADSLVWQDSAAVSALASASPAQ
jgi:parvulin-like peptidyl-prolyl isomerase